MNKKKKSTNTSPYPDEVIDRLARAFYPAILACWNSEEGQRSLVGARPLHLANARPFGRLKAPLGLSLLRCVALRKRELAYGRRNRLIIPPVKKTERSRRGTPCCTYRCCLWSLAGCVRVDAPCFCFYGNSCCPIRNEWVISTDSQRGSLVQNPPCKSCTDLAALRPIGAFPSAQQCIL